MTVRSGTRRARASDPGQDHICPVACTITSNLTRPASTAAFRRRRCLFHCDFPVLISRKTTLTSPPASSPSRWSCYGRRSNGIVDLGSDPVKFRPYRVAETFGYFGILFRCCKQFKRCLGHFPNRLERLNGGGTHIMNRRFRSERIWKIYDGFLHLDLRLFNPLRAIIDLNKLLENIRACEGIGRSKDFEPLL